METSIRPEDWSRYACALRRLAAELVGNLEQREELVQSTFVAALERPPRALSWRWLAAVLRNRARDLARARARQGCSEPLPELDAGAPEAAEIAQRLELQEDLTQALRALAEPYQSTLYLRYFEERTPIEIARRAGVPIKTVKTRLERGLALLRCRLEHRHGPGARALLLLLRPAGAPVSISTTFATGGLTLMWKNIALVAAALLALVFLWRSIRPQEREAGARPSGAVLVAAESPEREPPALEPPPAIDPREALVAAQEQPAARALSSCGSLRVRVLWSDGTAAPGIAVDVRAIPPANRFPNRGLTRATSDENGWALVRDLAPGKVSVHAAHGASAKAEVVAGEDRELVLQLAAGLALEGRVLDELDAPVAGAEIWLTSLYIDWLGMSRVAVSDSAGRFRLRDVPETQSLGATAEGFAPSSLADLELADVRTLPVEIVLRLRTMGGDLQGRVVDARGAAVSSAFVCVGVGRYADIRSDGTFAERWTPRLVQCDAEGRFRFTGLAPGSIPVEVKAATAPLWSSSVEVQAGVAAELLVTLQDGAALEGIVRDDHGAPVEHAFVRAFAQRVRTNFIAGGQYDDPSAFGSPLTLTDPAGRYWLEGVWSGEVHAYASPPRKEDEDRSEVHAEAVLHPVAGQALEWNPVLEPGRTIRGRVLFADGEPMPGVFVSAIEDGSAERRSLSVDDAGRFELSTLPAGPFRVEVQILFPRGAAPLFEEGVFPDGPELELVADFPSEKSEPGGRVRGRLVDAHTRFPRLLAVSLESPAEGYFDLDDGDAFEFRDVRPGRYRVVGSFGRETGYIGEELELAPGQELDLGTLEIPAGAELRVVLRRAPGLEQVPVRGYLFPHGLIGKGVALDFGSGDEAVLPNLTGGGYVLSLQGGQGTAQLWREFELSGDSEFELPVLPGAQRRIEIEFGAEAARGTLRVLVTGADGATYADTTYVRAWNKQSPKVIDLFLPVGRFAVHAETSSGFTASGELSVEAPGTPADPLGLVLR